MPFYKIILKYYFLMYFFVVKVEKEGDRKGERGERKELKKKRKKKRRRLEDASKMDGDALL
jgi:hypothetical protein